MSAESADRIRSAANSNRLEDWPRTLKSWAGHSTLRFSIARGLRQSNVAPVFVSHFGRDLDASISVRLAGGAASPATLATVP